MKKLLLALVVLAGLALPGMAQDCDQKWKYYKDETWFIEEMIKENDLECLEYYVDVEGFNLNDVKMIAYESLIHLVFDTSVHKPEILSFLFNHGIVLGDNDMDRIVFGMQFLYDEETDLFFKKFQILIKEYPDAWKKISDHNVKGIVISVSVAKDPARAIDLLLENNLPLSEYNRYIKSANKWLKELKRDRRKYNVKDKGYFTHTKWMEASEKLIESLQERRNIELQPVNENLQRVLNTINEENLNKIEEKTRNRYNYQF